mmetsp:Transcript_3129/g.4786  ORF Transcript_3129/g.4786 Transcript_3129/m.4786 type:complete len:212 (-) Transcript_3129:2076-2711(-)
MLASPLPETDGSPAESPPEALNGASDVDTNARTALAIPRCMSPVATDVASSRPPGCWSILLSLSLFDLASRRAVRAALTAFAAASAVEAFRTAETSEEGSICGTPEPPESFGLGGVSDGGRRREERRVERGMERREARRAKILSALSATSISAGVSMGASRSAIWGLTRDTDRRIPVSTVPSAKDTSSRAAGPLTAVPASEHSHSSRSHSP